MVDVKSGYSEARASNSDDEAGDSSGFVPSEGDSNQEESFSTKSATIENLPDICRRENLTLSEEICQLPPEWYNDGHDQMGESGHGGSLGDVHVVNLLEVLGLGDEEQVEGPGPGEVCHYDGPDGEASEHTQPGSREYCRSCRFRVSDGLLNVKLFSW